MDWEGHKEAHFLHLSQNFVTPNSMGESTFNGKSVIILLNLTLGPNLGVINNPIRPNSPKPACMANGMERAVSF